MINQVKEFLEQNNVSVAVLMDDAYDSVPVAEDLTGAGWNSFFDDLTVADEQVLRDAFGVRYDNLEALELAQDDLFIAALWNVKGQIKAAEPVFATYEQVQSQKKAALEPLVRLLRDDLRLTLHQVGRDASLLDLNGQLIFLDLFLGFHELKTAMKRAAEKVQSLLRNRPEEPPSIILLSASSEIKRLAPQLRDEAEILGCQFRWIPKSVLKDPSFVAETIYDLVLSHGDAIKLNHFMLSWERALERSKKLFMKSVRSLDLADYANVQALILESEGEPLGDYILDIYDLHLHSLLEGDGELIAAAKGLSTIDWVREYPPAQFMPSPELNTIMDGALFHNAVRSDSYFSEEPYRTPRLGEVLLGPAFRAAAKAPGGGQTDGSGEAEPSQEAQTDEIQEPAANVNTEPGKAKDREENDDRYAYVVLSQACDLQHCETDRLLLLRGRARRYSWKQHDRKSRGQMKTPIMRVGEELYSVDWEIVTPETWLLSELPTRLEGGIRRVRTFRLPFALQLQQAFISRLGRVGTLAALPTRYVAGIKIIIKQADNKAALILEASVTEGKAVCLVGRTGKNELMEWLLLSPDLKDQLRIGLQILNAEIFPRENPGVGALRSDPAFLRCLSRGLPFNREKKSSRPFDKTPAYDVVQIFTKWVIVAGQEIRDCKGLVIELDLEEAPYQ